MNSFFKTIIAGWGAKKLGGGCLSTILIFVLIYVALGQCSKTPERAVLQEKPIPAFQNEIIYEHKKLG